MTKRDARRPLAAIGLLALSLTACGKLGPLRQPPPMFGDAAKADYQARQAADAAAKAEKAEKQRAPVNPNAVADQPDPQPSTDQAGHPGPEPEAHPPVRHPGGRVAEPHGRAGLHPAAQLTSPD